MNSIQDHIKLSIEIFDEFGGPISLEDWVIYLLTCLPKSYNVFVTALETNSEVPKIDYWKTYAWGEGTQRSSSLV